jgi:CheY-like chemotaxis protein
VQRTIAIRVFKRLGIEHDIAANGEEAIERVLGAQGRPYDLVLMDNQVRPTSPRARWLVACSPARTRQRILRPHPCFPRCLRPRRRCRA